jgi:hypothetical protein
LHSPYAALSERQLTKWVQYNAPSRYLIGLSMSDTSLLPAALRENLIEHDAVSPFFKEVKEAIAPARHLRSGAHFNADDTLL